MSILRSAALLLARLSVHTNSVSTSESVESMKKQSAERMSAAGMEPTVR